MQVLLELTLWDEEQHHEKDWFTIQSFELNPFTRTSESANNFRNELGRSMWDSDAKSYSGAHRRFTLLNACQNCLSTLRLNLAMGYKRANQFVNSLPPVFGLQVNDNWLGAQEVVQIHFYRRA